MMSPAVVAIDHLLATTTSARKLVDWRAVYGPVRVFAGSITCPAVLFIIFGFLVRNRHLFAVDWMF